MSTRQQRLRALSAHLRTHAGVITTTELRRLGFTPGSIAHLVDNGTLEPIVFGAYRSRHHPLGEQQLMAAICAVNPSAAIGLTSAGRHFGIRGMLQRGVYAIVPHGSTPTWPGVTVRRCRALDPVDITFDGQTGIRYTSPPRTVHDCADLLGPAGTESAIEQLLMDRTCTFTTLVELSARLYHPSRPGARVFRDVLGSRPAWRRAARSELERSVREAIERRGLPTPEVNATLTLTNGDDIEVDLWWPRWQVVSEVDHPFWHDIVHQHAVDRRRDRALLAMGIAPVRLDKLDVDTGLRTALDELEAVLRNRGWRPSS